MNSERFEAFIDAIVAIIITVIVLEIPVPDIVTWSSIWALRGEFFAYFVSFLLCYNYWNNHQKFFSFIETVNHQVIWLGAASMFALSFMPYLTSMIIKDPSSYFVLFLYGSIFIIIDIFFLGTCHVVKKLHPGDIELEKRVSIIFKKIMVIIAIIVVGMIAGIAYPPAILYSCFGCLIASWLMVYLGIY